MSHDSLKTEMLLSPVFLQNWDLGIINFQKMKGEGRCYCLTYF